MSFDLSNLTTTTAVHPPRILIYGPPGLGKTTLASEFPSPVIMNLEGGVPADVRILTLGNPEDLQEWPDVIARLTALYTQEHDYRTLITDSLDRLETLAQRHVCKVNKWASIEDAGFGKGYVLASEILRHYLEGCNALRIKRGMNIIYIAHSTVNRFDDPQSAPYSKYDIRLNKHVNAMFEDDVDGIFFVNQDVSVASEEVGFGKTVKRAEGGGFRWIYAEARPAFNAKNRYGMPARLKFDKGQGYSALKPYLPAQEPKANKKKEAA